MRARMLLGLATVLVASCFAIAAGVARADDPPALPSDTPGDIQSGPSSTLGGSTGLYPCGSTASWCATKMGSLAAGTTVTMKCYQDWNDINGKSWRWFYITGPNHTEGFIHAEKVTVPSQTKVGQCGTSSWKGIWSGYWPLGSHVFGQTTWDHKCLEFVSLAYKNTSGLDICGNWCNASTTALDYWNKDPRGYGRHTSGPSFKTPERGALVFFSGSAVTSAGHVALSLGNGWLVSTWEGITPGVHLVTIGQITSKFGSNVTYLGWMAPAPW